MRKHLRHFLLALVMFGMVPVRVYAGSILERLQDVGAEAGWGGVITDKFSLAVFIGQIVMAAISLLGVIFFVQMVYAGFLWMTARGEAPQVEKAKETIRRSIIGLAIVLAAWSLSFFIIDRLVAASGVV
ncbi:MAG: hypothetical protein Q7S96_04920 [bacterium]|nr:hypothetical protein [bacterium]